MAIFYVALPNPYFKVGDFVEENHDDFVQKVKMRPREGHYEAGGWEGVCVPTRLLRSCLIRIQKSGLDPEIRKATAD